MRLTVTGDNLCIEHYDRHTPTKRHPTFINLKNEFGIAKCVDHALFQQTDPSGAWTLYLIEMKTKIGGRTWMDIQHKVRSSYLSAMSQAVYLGIRVDSTKVVITFESEYDRYGEDSSDPLLYKPRFGEKAADSRSDEWELDRVRIPLGERKEDALYFPAKKVKMERDTVFDMLMGELMI